MTYPPPPGDPGPPNPIGQPAGPPPDPTMPYGGAPVSGQPVGTGESYPDYGQPAASQYPGYGQPPAPEYGQPAMPAPDYGQSVKAPDPYAPAGYAPQPGYPMYGYQPAPQTNGLAIASMVVSIVSFVGLCGYGLGGYLGILGAILGHVAKRRIRESGESGDGMALAGIIIGWICAAIAVLATIAMVILFVWAVNQDPSSYNSDTGYGSSTD